MTRTSVSTSIIAMFVALFLATPVLASTSYYSGYALPACTISVGNYRSGSNGYDQTATLKWSSTNADRAHISGIGAVGTNGAYTLSYPKIGGSYTLTVYGNGGSSTCSTVGAYDNSYQNYNSYTNYPYVALTQIPYTGVTFDIAMVIVALALLAFVSVGGGYALTSYQRARFNA
jgi:hypothetical protein